MDANVIDTRIVFATIALVLVALLACGGASKDQLRTRAAYEMNCPEASLKIRTLDNRTAGVRGCGQQHVYVESCTGQYESNCTWVLNSEAKQK